MRKDYKSREVERENDIELQQLTPTVVKEFFTEWEMYGMNLVVVGILRNKKRKEYREILYKERGRDVNIDEDFISKVKRYFDIGTLDIFEIIAFHKIKFLGNGAED